MKKQFLILTLLLSVTVLFGQKYSIEGNVFFKYNEFVGNRPDAGAHASAIHLETKKRSDQATADVNGNYSITGLEPGPYLVVVVSKNTKEYPYYSFRQLKLYDSYLERAVGLKISQVDTALDNEIETKYQEYLSYMKSKNPKAKKMGEMRMQVIEKVFAFYNLFPTETIHLGFYTASDKVSFNYVELKDDNKKIVTDFGLTYY